MTTKPALSIDWLSSCSGCEIGIVDLHEKLFTLLEMVRLVRMPILMDTKAYVPAEIGIISGSIRTAHDLEAAREMRRVCKSIVAFGTCAVYGGPQGAAYAHTNRELLSGAFQQNPSTRTTRIPENVPGLLDGAMPLDAGITVDLYMPGCPPHAAYIFDGLTALLQSRSTRIGRHSVCTRCKRTMRKTDVAELRRPPCGDVDPKLCFLSQGYLCFGSVTLDRCLSPCPAHGVPCFSCGGPTDTIILEPQKDVRSEIAMRMAHLTRIPRDEIVHGIETQAKTHFAYAMASPVFRQKPTFLMKKWVRPKTAAAAGA